MSAHARYDGHAARRRGAYRAVAAVAIHKVAEAVLGEAVRDELAGAVGVGHARADPAQLGHARIEARREAARATVIGVRARSARGRARSGYRGAVRLERRRELVAAKDTAVVGAGAPIVWPRPPGAPHLLGAGVGCCVAAGGPERDGGRDGGERERGDEHGGREELVRGALRRGVRGASRRWRRRRRRRRRRRGVLLRLIALAAVRCAHSETKRLIRRRDRIT